MSYKLYCLIILSNVVSYKIILVTDNQICTIKVEFQQNNPILENVNKNDTIYSIQNIFSSKKVIFGKTSLSSISSLNSIITMMS